jgi:hypothetical protein
MKQPSKENPDKGVSQRHEGMSFDMGYDTQLNNESPYYPEGEMRGNRYTEMQNSIKASDKTKLVRIKHQKY